MSAALRCPHCKLTHTLRPDGLCPRCRKDVTARRVAAAPESSPTGQGSAKAVYGFVVLALLAAGGAGYYEYRDQAPLDYSMREGLLEPVRSGDWIESVDASARVRFATDGWYRHTDPAADRVLLSRPDADTHVVLRVETMGRGRRTPHSGVIVDRAIGRLEQNVTSFEVTKKERVTTEDGNAYRLDADVIIEETPLAYRYRLASKPGRVATLVCFGPPDAIGDCPEVLESFTWSS